MVVAERIFKFCPNSTVTLKAPWNLALAWLFPNESDDGAADWEEAAGALHFGELDVTFW